MRLCVLLLAVLACALAAGPALPEPLAAANEYSLGSERSAAQAIDALEQRMAAIPALADVEDDIDQAQWEAMAVPLSRPLVRQIVERILGGACDGSDERRCLQAIEPLTPHQAMALMDMHLRAHRADQPPRRPPLLVGIVALAVVALPLAVFAWRSRRSPSDDEEHEHAELLASGAPVHNKKKR